MLVAARCTQKDNDRMRYHALALDFDGTLARDGLAPPDVIDALQRLRNTNRRLIVVTGRELPDLLQLLPMPELFDRIVAENGGLLFVPGTGEERPLAEGPPSELVALLQERGVQPLSIGHVIIATWAPHQHEVLDAIQTLGLDHHIIFNKGAVMVLPPGVTKGSGLAAALQDLGLSPRNAVAVGDAENDHAMFALAECSVAVMNALPAVKDHADLVTNGDHGWGVIELVERMLDDDLSSCTPKVPRHQVLLGKQHDGEALFLPPPEQNVLIVGPSRSGKSTIAIGLLERILERGYQACIIDPEGDYECLTAAFTAGSVDNAPTLPEIARILDRPEESVVVNLLGVPYGDRPAFYRTLIPWLDQLRRQYGRPHWLVADEAHHMLPGHAPFSGIHLPQETGGCVFITVDPNHLAPDVLNAIDLAIATGPDPAQVLAQVATIIGATPPALPVGTTEERTALVWRRSEGDSVDSMVILPPCARHRRHRRKYAQGELSPERSFYFRGADKRFDIRAGNLMDFVRIGNQLDENAWRYHLDRGDYSRWLDEVIRDDELACEIRELEGRTDLPVSELRARLHQAIETAYTLPI